MSIEDSVNELIKKNREIESETQAMEKARIIQLAEKLYKYIYDRIVVEITKTRVYSVSDTITGSICGGGGNDDGEILYDITSLLFKVDKTSKTKGFILPTTVYYYTISKREYYWDMFFQRFNSLIKQEGITVDWALTEFHPKQTVGGNDRFEKTRFNPSSFSSKTFSTGYIGLEAEYHYKS